MKKLVLIFLGFCFFSLPLQGQNISALRALNDKVGAVADPFYKSQLDFLVDCLEDATERDLPYSTLIKYIDAYLCHFEYLAAHTPASQHLAEGRELIADLAWDFFLLFTFPDPPADADPPPDPPAACKVQMQLVLGNTSGFVVNGKFQTEEHRHEMFAKGAPEGGTYSWSIDPADAANTSFVSGGAQGERATVNTYRKGTLKAKVDYTVGNLTCEDMIKFTFR